MELNVQAAWLREVPERQKRWAHLTEAVKGDLQDRIGRPQVRWMTETLLDNLKIFLEDVVVKADVGPFTTFAFPLVRRVFPKLLANDLVSVQPMTQPTGKVFFFDTKYTGGTRRDVEANFDKTYATTGENTAVAEISFGISEQAVNAESKKLKAKWTIESAQDLRAYHGLDAESELMAAVADELVREIDRTIIDDLVANVPAGNVLSFTKAVPTTGVFSTIDPKIYKRTLYDKIVDANDKIFEKRYVNGTWILAGSEASTFLEKLEEFRIVQTGDPAVWQSVMGPHLFGVLANRWVIYKDPWFTTTRMIMGYRGPTFMHAGYVYAPYIPVFTTPILVDPNDFTSRRGMMSRFAKAMVIPEMYAQIDLV